MASEAAKEDAAERDTVGWHRVPRSDDEFDSTSGSTPVRKVTPDSRQPRGGGGGSAVNLGEDCPNCPPPVGPFQTSSGCSAALGLEESWTASYAV